METTIIAIFVSIIRVLVRICMKVIINLSNDLVEIHLIDGRLDKSLYFYFLNIGAWLLINMIGH